MEKDNFLTIALCFSFCLAIGLIVGSAGLGIALGLGVAAGMAWEDHLQSRRQREELFTEPAE